MIEDKYPPAGEILADILPCGVDGAVRHLAAGHMPEERACLRKFCKDAFVQEEFVLIGINRYFGFFRSILVVNNKVKVPQVFTYAMDKPQMGTALPALVTLKPHTPNPDNTYEPPKQKNAPRSS
jgi:hypothetical protein